jgi:hypothetical protein
MKYLITLKNVSDSIIRLAKKKKAKPIAIICIITQMHANKEGMC